LEINNAIASRLEMREFIKAVSNSLRGIFQHELIALSIYEPELERFRLHALNFPGGQGFIHEGITMSAKGTLLGKVLTGCQPIRVSELQPGDLPAENVELSRREGLKSGAIFPLIVADRVIGTVNVVSKRENSVSDEDMGFLSQIAGQVAVGLANALAYKQIDELKNKLQEEKRCRDGVRSELQ